MFVAAPEWTTRYGMGLSVIVPFPGLPDVEQPRVESSAPRVAESTVVRDPAGDAQLLLRTGAEGDATISLFDGAALVRTESIQILNPNNWHVVLTTTGEPELDPREPISLAWGARVSGRVAFFQGETFTQDAEIVASARIESATRVLISREDDDRPLGVPGDISRVRDQLNTGDLVSIIVDRFPVVVLEFPNGEKLFQFPFPSQPGEFVSGLQVLVGDSMIAVYGLDTLSGELHRVVGLDPTVTLDGERLLAQGTSSWLFRLPFQATGTVEASWKGHRQVVEITATE